MTEAMTIRPGRPEEIPAVLDLWRHDPDALLVALADGRIVGTAIAAWDGWRGGIWRLAVVPEARRRGVARALVSEAEAQLRAKGVRRMSILVESMDPQALAFWEARADLGYTRDPGARRYTKNLGGGLR